MPTNHEISAYPIGMLSCDQSRAEFKLHHGAINIGADTQSFSLSCIMHPALQIAEPTRLIVRKHLSNIETSISQPSPVDVPLNVNVFDYLRAPPTLYWSDDLIETLALDAEEDIPIAVWQLLDSIRR
jgi:hypothetical protein